jgi:hypothetical protein
MKIPVTCWFARNSVSRLGTTFACVLWTACTVQSVAIEIIRVITLGMHHLTHHLALAMGQNRNTHSGAQVTLWSGSA